MSNLKWVYKFTNRQLLCTGEIYIVYVISVVNYLTFTTSKMTMSSMIRNISILNMMMLNVKKLNVHYFGHKLIFGLSLADSHIIYYSYDLANYLPISIVETIYVITLWTTLFPIPKHNQKRNKIISYFHDPQLTLSSPYDITLQFILIY